MAIARSGRMRAIRSIALIDPVSDAGIGGFTHELAEGLTDCDVAVDVYARGGTYALELERRYRLHPVLGAESTPAPRGEALGTSAPGVSALDPYFDVLARRGVPAGRVRARPAEPDVGPVVARAMTAADAPASGHSRVAASIAATRPDIVWTQWPELGADGAAIHAVCRTLDLPIVHTVHNVLPHERSPDDVARHDACYRDASALVVHSDMAARALAGAFPHVRRRIVPSRHGLYTIFPRRPGTRNRVRERLEIDHGGQVVLMFGGVRPYKNLDAVLAALADERCAPLTLVVAGWEWGYAERVRGDRLGRTRAQVWRAGLGERARLLPGPFGRAQAAELFEAADAVVLPYVEGWGSGLLLLAMTFGKHVLATAVGGMHEYLATYGDATPLAGPSAAQVADGLAAFAARGPLAAGGAASRPPADLAWPAIARQALADLSSEARLGRPQYSNS